jgi:hypothetical protein
MIQHTNNMILQEEIKLLERKLELLKEIQKHSVVVNPGTPYEMVYQPNYTPFVAPITPYNNPWIVTCTTGDIKVNNTPDVKLWNGNLDLYSKYFT